MDVVDSLRCIDSEWARQAIEATLSDSLPKRVLDKWRNAS